MPTLLHIDTSASPISVSRKVAGAFADTWNEEMADSTTVYRDLVADPVPHVDQPAVKTLMEPAENPDDEVAAALHDTLAEELLSADSIVVSAPMYNWCIPSNLKAWFDQVLIMGRTLPWDPSTNPLAGRPATVCLAYGGDYSPGTEDAELDHCGPYLRTVFETVLGFDLEIITVRNTVAALTSDDPEVHAEAERTLEEALAAARQRATAAVKMVADGAGESSD